MNFPTLDMAKIRVIQDRFNGFANGLDDVFSSLDELERQLVERQQQKDSPRTEDVVTEQNI